MDRCKIQFNFNINCLFNYDCSIFKAKDLSAKFPIYSGTEFSWDNKVSLDILNYTIKLLIYIAFQILVPA